MVTYQVKRKRGGAVACTSMAFLLNNTSVQNPAKHYLFFHAKNDAYIQSPKPFIAGLKINFLTALKYYTYARTRYRSPKSTDRARI
jgi:hypothetical protein